MRDVELAPFDVRDPGAVRRPRARSDRQLPDDAPVVGPPKRRGHASVRLREDDCDEVVGRPASIEADPDPATDELSLGRPIRSRDPECCVRRRVPRPAVEALEQQPAAVRGDLGRRVEAGLHWAGSGRADARDHGGKDHDECGETRHGG
jgi:hypothetical protein